MTFLSQFPVSFASKLDSLLVAFQTQDSDPQKVDILNMISWEYYYVNLDSMLIYANKAEQLNSARFEKALASTYTYKGVYYEMTANSDKAFEYYAKAKKIQENINDSTGLAFTYTNLGWFYYSQFDYHKAINQHQKSYDINAWLNDSISMANNLQGIAVAWTYLDTINYDKPIYYYQKAIEVYKIYNQSYYLASVYINLAKIYVELNNYNKAVDYYNMAEDISSPNDFEIFRSIYFAKATMYANNKNYDLALAHLRTSTNYALKIGAAEKLKYHYDFFTDLFEKSNQFDSALVYYKKSIAIKDSIFNLDTKQKIAELEIQYESEKKENELIKSQLELKKTTEKNNKASTNIRLLTVGIALVIVILLAFIFMYYQKIKNTKLLEEKNKTISNNLEEKEVLLGEIHHRVKNNLQLVSTMLQLQANDINNKTFIKLIQESRGRIQTMALIHQVLYDHNDLRGIEMKTYLKKLILKLQQAYGNDLITTQFNIADLKLNIDTAIPVALIVNEIYTNSLKYAFNSVQSPTVNISLADKQNHLLLVIKDNGTGYDVENTKQSFGSKLVKSFSRQIKADIEINSTKNGTTITLKIHRYDKIT